MVFTMFTLKQSLLPLHPRNRTSDASCKSDLAIVGIHATDYPSGLRTIDLNMVGNLISVFLSLEVTMEKMPTDLVQHVLLRCAAWGFSSSGVERSFSIGSWAKHVKREVTPDLACDEVLAIQFPEQHVDEYLPLNSFQWQQYKGLNFKL